MRTEDFNYSTVQWTVEPPSTAKQGAGDRERGELQRGATGMRTEDFNYNLPEELIARNLRRCATPAACW